MPASEKIGDFIITVINDGIFSYSTDGSIKKELYTGYVCSYAYDKDYIYYVALHEGALFRTTPDGNKTEKLLYVDIATRLYDYYIQGEKLYIKTAINPETGNLDANINYYVSNTSDIKFEPCDEETYNQNLKSKNNFTDGNRSLIIKPVETSENEVEILNMHLPKSKFVVHKNHLYFLSGSRKTKTFLYQMNLDGTGKKIICKIPFDYPINISVIDEMLYINAANIDDEFDDFVITKTPVFLKCSLNGTGLTTVLNSEKNLLPETKILAQKGSIKITDSGIYKNGIVLESNLTIKNAYIFGDDIYYIRLDNPGYSLNRINLKTLKPLCLVNTKTEPDIVLWADKNNVLYTEASRLMKKSLNKKTAPVFMNCTIKKDNYLINKNIIYFYDTQSLKIRALNTNSLNIKTLFTPVFKESQKPDSIRILNLRMKGSKLFFTEEDYYTPVFKKIGLMYREGMTKTQYELDVKNNKFIILLKYET